MTDNDGDEDDPAHHPWAGQKGGIMKAATAIPRKILRHKTAISRRTLSMPARKALEAGVLNSNVSVLDYGCGRGDDVRHLQELGITATGWDPYWKPEPAPSQADIVTCIFVINIIEVFEERAETLRKAYVLARKGLVVAGRVDKPNYTGTPYGDGVVTTAGTFQHFYTQGSLRAYLRKVFGKAPVALGPGVFLVEKN